MITAHRLKAEEFKELDKVSDGFRPDPRQSTAIVMKENGEYVGRIFLLAPAHVEGPWVREDKRGSLLFAILVGHAEAEARKIGIKELFAYGANKEMEGYIERLGYKKQELTVWKKEI